MNSTCQALFIHGLGGNRKQWQAVISDLSSAVNPLYWDLPGHGEGSDHLSEGMEQLLQDMDRFILNERIQEPITLIGHSLGGFIALAYYFLHPEKIKQLVLLSTAANMIIHPMMIAQLKSKKVDKEFIEQGLTDYLSQAMKNQIIEDMSHVNLRKDTNDLLGLSSLNFSSQLMQVKCRTLIILGSQDKIVSPRRSQDMAKKIAHCETVVLNGIGHYPHLEASQKVADCINNFLITE